MLSARGARRLKPLLDGLLDPARLSARIEHDPVRIPRRFADPRDAEVAGLFAACLAYGKAELFLARLEALFAHLGPSPAKFAVEFDPAEHREFFGRFVYRFNVGADVASLVSAAGGMLRRHGGLEAPFAGALARRGELREALADWVSELKAAIDPRVASALGPTRAMNHLLPDPLLGGANKRLLLFLRWMVRGASGDPVDLGLWRRISPATLLVPLDTHVGRVSMRLGLTSRKDLSWRTAVEITASLRLLDPEDPVRYDFALCHLGMSGGCPARPGKAACAACALGGSCRNRRTGIRGL